MKKLVCRVNAQGNITYLEKRQNKRNRVRIGGKNE